MKQKGMMVMKRKSYRYLLIAAALVLAVAIFAPASVLAGEKVRHFSISLKPSVNSMKISWKRQKDIDYYRILCRDVTKDLKQERSSIPLPKYSRVGKISGKKFSFTDRTLVRGHSYAYVVQGFARSGEKARLVSTSYVKDDFTYDTVCLATPELLNGGSGEFFTNSGSHVYLYVQSTSGLEPTGCTVWRRAEGEKDFEKIKVYLADEGDPDAKFGSGSTVVDTNVTSGVTYEYKVCTTVRRMARKYTSAESNILRIPVVDFTGIYDVVPLTENGSESLVDLKLTARLSNGKLVLKPGASGYEQVRIEDRDHEFPASVTQVSRDGKVWRDIPAAGEVFEAGDTLYLRIELKPDGAEEPFYSCYSKMVLDENLDYDGPGVGNANLIIEGENAQVYQDFD